ncbi:hypothetical protein LOZ80_36150 [Paenibacillus sp. HWE-109]|uniref:hypothetical protein n=1 Tax=Paenibacillus sp. HWE-109 TaxID=1306526 RepID=UPI001EE0BCAD|nr:hypothetical protein [Paenibacillus sp. HWE-109]UKS26835.1 hypothetical protein LOZ80_36150 [Paenibacillus sp. HWE-109]
MSGNSVELRLKFSVKAESGAKVWLVTLKNSVTGHAEVNRAESSRSESSRIEPIRVGRAQPSRLIIKLLR